MRLILSLLITLAVISGTFAQQTVIRGTAPGAELKKIMVTAPSDLITFREQTLAVSTIDSVGAFSLSLMIPETCQVTISIDFHETELFTEPGHTYNLSIEPMQYEDYTEINPFIKSQKLAVDLTGNSPDELNAVIEKFNNVYTTFLQTNFNALYRDRNKAILDTFRIKLNDEFGANKNLYFLNYAKYKFASLEQLTKYRNQAQLANKFFNGVPILYENVEYMDFFNNFFSKYMTSSSNILRKIDFRTMMQLPNAYPVIMKAMVADTLVKSEQLRELVLLKGMMEVCQTTGENGTQALAIIRSVEEKSKYPDNKTIAGNLIKVLTNLKPGSPAPDFTLPDRYQKPVALKNFKGKPVLLNFWTTYCESCLSEMDLLKPLYDKYGQQVDFISISADKYFSKMLYFIDLKRDYNWNFLHINDESGVLKEYDARNYPLFVLLDQDHNIYKFPADLPGNGLETDLQQLTGK